MKQSVENWKYFINTLQNNSQIRSHIILVLSAARDISTVLWVLIVTQCESLRGISTVLWVLIVTQCESLRGISTVSRVLIVTQCESLRGISTVSWVLIVMTDYSILVMLSFYASGLTTSN